MERIDITERVQKVREFKYTDDELCKRLGISRPTLYVRMKKHNWKKGEIVLSERL